MLNMHGTKMFYHCITKYYKTLSFDWLCSKPSKCNVKCAGAGFVALP